MKKENTFKIILVKMVEKLIKNMVKSFDFCADSYKVHNIDTSVKMEAITVKKNVIYKNNSVVFEIVSYPSDIETTVYIELCFEGENLILTHWRNSSVYGLYDSKEHKNKWYQFNLNVIKSILNGYLKKSLAYS